MPSRYPEANNELKIRKTVGREHLNANRIEDALAVYAGILRDFPEDVESLVILGDLYLASGDSSTALQLYSRAMQQRQEDVQIEQRLTLAQAEKDRTPKNPPETIPTHPEAVNRLLQRLTGRPHPIPEQEILRAAELLEIILKSPRPSQKVADHLDEIDNLLPALLELNIRQARADGRYDLVEDLNTLQNNIQLQLKTPDASLALPSKSNGRKNQKKMPTNFTGRALFLVSSSQQPSVRASLLAASIKSLGGEVVFSSTFSDNSDHLPQIVVASNPHVDPQLMSALASCAAVDLPILIDLDSDFERIPPGHPRYHTHGAGNPAAIRSYTSAMLLANMITVPSQAIANNLQNNGFATLAIPDGWSKRDPGWRQKTKKRKKINLGWVGQTGHVEDVARVRRVVVRILREFPETQLVICGDQQVYQLFESIPTKRRKFIPFPPPEEYPFTLEQFDILMVPHRDTPYNRSLSDRLLMEANVKGIPWLASPMPSFLEWNAGGAFARTVEDWYSQLKKMVMDADFRQALLQAGIKRAQSREIEHIKHAWLNAINLAHQSMPIKHESQ